MVARETLGRRCLAPAGTLSPGCTCRRPPGFDAGHPWRASFGRACRRRDSCSSRRATAARPNRPGRSRHDRRRTGPQRSPSRRSRRGRLPVRPPSECIQSNRATSGHVALRRGTSQRPRALQRTPTRGARPGAEGCRRSKGSERHLEVDTPGRLLALPATPTRAQEHDQLSGLAKSVQPRPAGRPHRSSSTSGPRRPGRGRQSPRARAVPLCDPFAESSGDRSPGPVAFGDRPATVAARRQLVVARLTRHRLAAVVARRPRRLPEAWQLTGPETVRSRSVPSQRPTLRQSGVLAAA